MKQYKLINLTTKVETLCEKVEINGFDYYVNDNPIKQGQYQWYHKNESKKPILKAERDLDNDGYRKLVIATTNPNIDIPKVIDEVEELAYKLYPRDEFWVGDKATGRMYDQNAKERIHFIKGYNQSQSTHQNSDEDMVEFGNWLRKEDTEQNAEKYAGFSDKDMLQLFKDQQIKKIYYK